MEEISNKTKIILIILSLIPIAIVIFYASLIIVNAQEVIESDNLIIQKMNGNTLVGNYEASSDVNGYSFYNMSNSISATTSDIKILTKSAINTSGNVAIYTFALYPNNNTENIVRNVQVLGNSCSFETKKISDTTSDHYFVVNVVCPVESVNLGINWVVTQVKLSNAQLRGVGIGDITFTNTNQDVINELQGISGNVTNLLSRLTAIDNNIYNIINRQDAIVTTIINATSTITNAINSQNNAINNQTQQQQDNHDEIMNEDIDNTTKQDVDQTQYNNYKNKEQQLMGVTSGTNLNDLNIGLDSGTSSTIWQLITRIIQQNAKIFGLFISILSIGIIKIALAR